LSRISSLSEQPFQESDFPSQELASAMADDDCPIAASKLLANPEIEDGMASNGLGSSYSSQTGASQASQTAKPRPGFLPSFEQLGIAAPHPDRILPVNTISQSDLHGFFHSSPPQVYSLSPVKALGLQHVSVFTPPAEDGPSSWSPAIVKVSGMTSPLIDGGDLNANPVDVDPSPSASPVEAATKNIVDSKTVESDGSAWIDGAVSVLCTSIDFCLLFPPNVV